MANWTDSVKIRKLFKALQNKSDTSADKKFYEETIPYRPDIHITDVYGEAIPQTPPSSSTSVVKCWTDTADGHIVLTRDRSVPDAKAWVALNSWQSSWSSGSGDVTQILRNFISPKYGKDYVVKVYHGDGTQISELDNVSWIFDYKNGVLTFEEDPGDSGNTQADSIYIEVYQYVGAMAGGGGGGTAASDQPINTPSDGKWEDGLFAWQVSHMIKDAIDDLNEALGQLAPEDADPLQGDLDTSLIFYSGILPSGLTAQWYQDGKSAGDQVDTLVKDISSFTASSPNPSTAFHKGDQGTLEALLNGAHATTIDIDANFDETLRDGSQNLTDWDNQGSGDPVTDAVSTFTGGSLEILDDSKYNNFSLWQKMNARINITDGVTAGFHEGYNTLQLIHHLSSGDESTNELKFWYDDDNTAVTIDNHSVTENTISSSRYLSGIQFYSVGDTFDITYQVHDAFNKAYHPTAVSYYTMPGLSQQTRNPSSVPAYTDDLQVNDTGIALDTNDVMSIDAVVSITAQTPYPSETITVQTTSENRLVCTYNDGAGGQSTDTREYFTDEYYRLPSTFNFDDKTAAFMGQWNSQNPLSNGDAQVYHNGTNPALVYPTIDFTSGYLPTQQAGTDYSTFTGDQIYYRTFIKSTATNAQVTLYGVSGGIDTFGNGDINIAIKLPTQTAWLDVAKPYSSSDGVDDDGDGCLSGSINYTGGNAVINVTFGGKSTFDSNDRIYMRITLRNSNRTIEGVELI